MEEKKTGGNGLAIASFVLALVGGLLCIILIGLPLGILCLVLSFIFGIVALCKNQTKRASILGIIISIFWMVIIFICSKFVLKLWNEHKDQILTPVTEFSEWINNNPEIAALMEDENLSDEFSEILREKLEEKYGNNYSDIKDLDGIFDVWADTFKEMQIIATELAEQEGINAIVPVDIEETTAEIHECGEFYKTEEEIVCTEQYEPVCGANGQTYGNSCFACIEVDSYTDGECSETAPAPAAKLMVQEGQTEEETQAMIQETCTNAGGELVDGNCVLEDGSVIAF